MKKNLLLTALAMMAVAMDGKGGRYYRDEPVKAKRELTDQEKLKRHREYGADQTMHEYTINGVVIRATSKKVALKIYRRMAK
jgi:hypothetical protein